MNMNANVSECIQAQHNIGFTTFHNICTGAQQTVAWGSADWFLAITVIGVIAGMIGWALVSMFLLW